MAEQEKLDPQEKHNQTDDNVAAPKGTTARRNESAVEIEETGVFAGKIPIGGDQQGIQGEGDPADVAELLEEGAEERTRENQPAAVIRRRA